MGRREQQIEHLLRRAGFGGSPDEIDLYAEVGVNGTIDLLLNYEQLPDDVDARIGQARLRRGDDTRAVPARTRTSPTRASAGCSAWSTRGARCRRRWRSSGTTTSPPPTARSPAPTARRGHAHDGREAAPRIPRRAAGRSSSSASYALGNFRDLLVAVAQDPAMLVWLDGRHNIRGTPQENFAPRGDGAVHVGVGQLHRGRRQRGGAGVHGLEPAARRGDRHATTDALPVLSQRRPPRHGRQDVLVPDLPGRRTDDSAPTASRRASTSSRRSPAPGDGAAPRAQAVRVLRQRDLTPATAVVRGPRGRRVTTAATTTCAPCVRRCCFARVPGPVELLHALLLAGRVRRESIKETGWTGFSVDDALSPLLAMGQTLFEPPDVNGWELGPAGSRPAACSRA